MTCVHHKTIVLALSAFSLLIACGESDTPSPATDSESQASVDAEAGASDTTMSDDVTPSTDRETTSDVDPGPTGDTSAAPEDVTEPAADVSVPSEDVSEPSEDVTEPSVDVTEPMDAAGPSEDASEPMDAAAPSEDGTTQADDVAQMECTLPCDCAQQGADCVDGVCILGVKPVFCCASEGCPEGEPCVDIEGAAGLCGAPVSAASGVLIVNEVLTDGTVDGDPNGDGDAPDGAGDEFVELVNGGVDALDISGFQLLKTSMPFLPRHTFDQGTIVPPGDAIVVFGGGTAPDAIEGAVFVVANANDPGTALGLSLNNEGDSLSILDAEGLLVSTFAYGPGTDNPLVSDQSYVRSPELSGDFVGHAEATGSDGALFSPGTRTDGTSF